MTTGTGVRELAVISGDGVGREIVPRVVELLRVLLPGLRCHDVLGGLGEARLSGRAIGEEGIERIRAAGAALVGPEYPFPPAHPSARLLIAHALDLYAVLYPIRERGEGHDRLLLTVRGPLDVPRDDFGPELAYTATRLGNLAARLARLHDGTVALLADADPRFDHALRAGIAANARLVPIDPADERRLRAQPLVVAGARAAATLAAHLSSDPATRAARLMIGPRALIASPLHGPRREEVGWGFTSPLGTLAAAEALLRYWWESPGLADRLARAIDRALARRRTPDLGGIHTMLEVLRAVRQELDAD